MYAIDKQDRRRRIDRAKEVLRDIHHVPVSTVNSDGSPHASPVLFVFDDALHGFWASSPDSLHSQNIARDPRVFLCVFDSRAGHSGLFLSGTAVELSGRQTVARGLERLETLKKQLYGDEMANISGYIDAGSQRVYEFIPEHAWVNHSERQGGVIVRDWRYEIDMNDLRTS
jgi:hypothetical protein